MLQDECRVAVVVGSWVFRRNLSFCTLSAYYSRSHECFWIPFACILGLSSQSDGIVAEAADSLAGNPAVGIPAVGKLAVGSPAGSSCFARNCFEGSRFGSSWPGSSALCSRSCHRPLDTGCSNIVAVVVATAASCCILHRVPSWQVLYLHRLSWCIMTCFGI